MVKKTIARFYSDISGDEIDSGQPTLHFSIDGSSYEVDVTASERDDFQAAIATFIAAGRKSTNGRRAKSNGVTNGGPAPAAVRAWAREQGLDVPARGRIPSGVVDAYRAAN